MNALKIFKWFKNIYTNFKIYCDKLNLFKNNIVVYIILPLHISLPMLNQKCSINYRFYSCKNFSTIKFEGSSITLWELRFEVINQRRMNAKDFELVFYDADTEEKYENEYAKIFHNSNILIKRVPLWMADSSCSQNTRSNYAKNTTVPPDTYVCYRCNKKGHYIQNCPTNNDRAFDQLRTKVPAGVPKDFLQKVGEDHMQMVVQKRVWKRKQNLLDSRINQLDDGFKCEECRGILENAQRSSCGHYFCEGCALEREKCIKCRKLIFYLKSDLRKQGEVENYLQRL